MKRHTLLSWFACAFALSVYTHAQATPTASRAGNIQVGIAGTYVNPDFGGKKNLGPSVYGTFDFTRHIGIEGDIHFTSVIAPSDYAEESYLIGPRFVLRRGRFAPYAKVLGGIGLFKTQFDTRPHTSEHHKVYAFGGGLDLRVTRRINVRAIDFEYQKWPGFQPHGLSPIVLGAGVAYSF